MARIPAYTSYTTWTVEELIEAMSPNPSRNKKVTIPEFQRRLTWPPKKREGLIRSIMQGFPFGSLLVYKDTDSDGALDNYKLIDGLQRTQTLMQYMDKPYTLFGLEKISDDLIILIASEINHYSDIDCLAARNIKKIGKLISTWVVQSRGFTESAGWSVSTLTEELLRNMLNLEDETKLFVALSYLLSPDSVYRQQVQKFLDSIRSKIDISRVEIPVIVFSGPSNHLAKVFVLLNREGIQLHRYEIYAAQWLDCRYRIENSEIINAIWKKYGELQKAGFTLDVALEAPDERAKIERKYTLFEYLFGLGQLLAKQYALFFKPVKVDQPSPFGFNLMSACIAGSVTEKVVRQLPENIRGLELSRLEECILESIEFVYRLFKPVLSPHRIGQMKIPYYHADLQIVAQIAMAFRVRYNTKDLTELEGWEKKRQTLTKNLPMYFLQDVLQSNWQGSGDSKLAECLENEIHLRRLPPSKETWNQIFNVWFRNHVNTRHHAQSYIKDDFAEYLLLRYFSVNKLQKSDSYYVQHIIPIPRLISPPSYYHEYYGPINTIGNLAIIAEDDYIDLGDKTYVEYLNRRRGTGAIRGPGYYNDERRKWEDLLHCEENLFPSELRQQAFESFLKGRFELQKAEFFKVWSDHIPPDPQA